MNFPEAMLVFGIMFVCGGLAIGKILAYFGVRKFIEEEDEPKIKPHYK